MFADRIGNVYAFCPTCAARPDLNGTPLATWCPPPDYATAIAALDAELQTAEHSTERVSIAQRLVQLRAMRETDKGAWVVMAYGGDGVVEEARR